MLARLSADPRVVRYVGTGEPWTAARALEVSDHQAEHWHLHGFGWRVILEKSTGEEIGLLALNYMADGAAGIGPQEYEIGWWLDPSRWGVGYASEAAAAVAKDAFAGLEAPRLLARIQPPNGPSIAVARSIGMTHLLDTTARFGEPVAIYAVDRPPGAVA